MNKGKELDPPEIDWDNWDKPSNKKNCRVISTKRWIIHDADEKSLRELLLFDRECYWWIDNISNDSIIITVTHGAIPSLYY